MKELNAKIINFHTHLDNYGSLVPVEAHDDIPFDVKRVYYIYDVEQGVRRGFHSHKDLQQVLIAVHGKVTILVKTPNQEQNILLDDPTKGLYIGPMVWREMYDFSEDAVLLVLASKHFDQCDYIRGYDNYLKLAKGYFENLEN